MNLADTIAAISSAIAPAPRMILRLSGPRAWPIAAALAGVDPVAGAAPAVVLRPPGVAAQLYVFAGPRSYTGQDLVEFHIPGSPVLARMILDDLVRRGARHAEPGEFTARAYFSGRLDLTQAEGVAATIAAQSQSQAAAARRLLAGELARRIAPILDQTAQALALIEAGIDFADEDISFISTPQLEARCQSIIDAIQTLLEHSPRFERLAHEPRIVLVGRPNAGKSTLLNALAGQRRAVVSDIPGTTRDALSAPVRLRRGIVQMVDVAGLEAPLDARAESPAAPTIEQQMQQRALDEVQTADLVILVQDPAAGRPPPALAREPDLLVYSKADLTARQTAQHGGRDLHVSARTGQGLELLRARLDALLFGGDSTSSADQMPLNHRHVQALRAARRALARALEAAPAGPELAALELRAAANELGQVVGEVSPDDLLGRIFSQFCIGK